MASTVLGLGANPAGFPEQIGLPDFAARVTAPTIGTYWRTLRPFRASQWLALARRRILPRQHFPKASSAPVRLRPLPVEFPEWRPELALSMLERREFCFLNTSARWLHRVVWSSEGFDRLWLYHLNYFDFLNLDLRPPQYRAHLAAAAALALDWREQNSTGAEIGWEPYPLSMRIVNWLKFLGRNADGLQSLDDGQAVPKLLASLNAQTLALEAQLETDLTANHLLKNIKALIFAGTFMESPNAAGWRRKGEAFLTPQIREQVLSDGGHFERSPMYHGQVMEDLLDLQDLSAACGQPLACEPDLLAAIARMAGFLRNILHPDGEIPLFNDSSLGVTQPAEELLSRASRLNGNISGARRETVVFTETGYGVMRDRRGGCLIFDCGPLGPDHQPGHGHCDVLNYELSLAGRRVVVDTGVSTYERGPERHYERSTCAHNTIRVDGEEQAEIWASFRAGRKPRVGSVQAGTRAGCRFIRAEHSGYQRLGVIHQRTVFHVPPDSWVIADSLRGAGLHRIDSFIHFHPEIMVERCPNEAASSGVVQPGARWLIRFGNDRYYLAVLGGGDLRKKQSWYSPEFGLRQNRTAIHWTLESPLPALMVYAFVPAGNGVDRRFRMLSGKSIQLGQFTLDLD